MIKTRDRILNAAHQLFNSHGVPNVTLRRIAAEAGISQGNLTYYFKKREEIIEALYFRLMLTFEAEKSKLDSEEMDLQFIFDSTRNGMVALYEYRFLMIDFNQVMRENPTLHANFIALEHIRKITYLKSFDIAISKNILRKPEFEGEYENLVDRIRVFSDFWIASAEVYPEPEDVPVALKYHQLLVETFYPYFTPEAKEAFLKVRHIS